MTLAALASNWAEEAIEEACARTQAWYRTLPRFEPQVNLRTVVGARYPAILSERDCVTNFVRFLHDAGVPWDAMHHEMTVSRWMFDKPHPAATAFVPGERRRVDLALVRTEDFLAAELPATENAFQFEAFLEFKYLSAYWTAEKARVFNNDPAGGRLSVEQDVEKLGRQLESGACRAAYVVVFEDCDWGFAPPFAVEAELTTRCRVRFVHGYSRDCPACGSSDLLPIVWGMPSPELEQLTHDRRVVLGGCLVHGDGRDPHWQCGDCDHRWSFETRT
jgi:hypothetical protein